MLRFILFLFLFCISLNSNANNNVPDLNVTDLNKNAVQKWESKSFNGQTIYSIVNYKGKRALKAQSDGDGSGLLLKKKIDLQKTPFLNWSWLIEKKLPTLNERIKAGDDYVARVYVVINTGVMAWSVKSINYVWSSSQNKGQIWKNPYFGSKVKMFAIRGKEDGVGQWYNEKRNVYQDLIKQFGDKGSEAANLKSYRYIHIVAVMTDADNSKSQAETYYGDLIFSDKQSLVTDSV